MSSKLPTIDDVVMVPVAIARVFMSLAWTPHRCAETMRILPAKQDENTP